MDTPMDTSESKYGARLPSRHQLGDVVMVEGKRCSVLAVHFELIDFDDGLGLGPKILYKVGYPTGGIRTVYSQDASPTTNLRLVERCIFCGDTGMRDSGGSQPWGDPIFLPCECSTEPDSLRNIALNLEPRA